MKKLLKRAWNFVKEEQGATAVEYGIMVAAIAAVIIAIVILVGSRTNAAFGIVEGNLDTIPGI